MIDAGNSRLEVAEGRTRPAAEFSGTTEFGREWALPSVQGQIRAMPQFSSVQGAIHD